MTDPIRLGVAIMADRRRDDMVPDLLARLDADPVVVWDLCDCEHGRDICQKPGHRDRWRTGARAMQTYREQPGVTHWLVVQDDALICQDLIAGATRALKVVSDQPVSFFTGTVRPEHHFVTSMVDAARAAGESWLTFNGPWWGVALALPVGLIDPATAYAERYPKIQNYDVRLARGLQGIGYDCWYTLPSLADHRQGHDSLIPGGRPQGRRAQWFLGEDASALDVEWGPPPAPAFREVRRYTRLMFQCVTCGRISSQKTTIQRHALACRARAKASA